MMPTILFALPIKPGQAAAARTFIQECIGPRCAAHDASERERGIRSESWYLQHTPGGDFFTCYAEGPDLQTGFGALIASRRPFDLWFKHNLLVLTGIDLNAGPPPAEMIAETLAEYKGGGPVGEPL